MVSNFSVPGLHYFLITSGLKGQDTFNDFDYLYGPKAFQGKLNIKDRIYIEREEKSLVSTG